MSGETTTAEKQAQHQADTSGIDVLDGESVLENRRPSWTLWWKHILLALVLLMGGIAGDAAIGGIILAGLILAYVVFSRSKSRYIVTNERIKGKIGVISTKTIEYRIADLRSIGTSQSFFERLVGHGTIEFQSGASNKLIWHGVPDFEQVANTVREKQRDYE